MKIHTPMFTACKSTSMSLPFGYRELVATRLNNTALVTFLLFVIFAPLTVGGGPLSVAANAGSSGSAGEGSILRQIVYLVIFGIALYGARIVRNPAALLTPPVAVLLMLAWCCLSISWAINPGVGARRLFLTLITVWTVFLLVEKAGYEKTVTLVRCVLLIVLLANYLAVLLLPSWAIHQAVIEDDPRIVGAWRGVLMSKNFAGVACALTVIFFSFDAKSIRRTLRVAVVAASVMFLYQSHSKTSMALLASCFILVALYRLYKPYYRWVLCLFLMLGGLLVGLLAHEYWDLVTEPFSRPDALTGRVQIWPVLVRYWQDHWLLGSGFGSFWNVGEPKPISLYGGGWVVNDINSGHNGFLDLLVQTGLPGLVLAVLAAFIAPVSKILMHPSLIRARANLLLACIWFGVCHNFTESSLFDRDATVHVFLMLAIALLAMEERGQGMQQRYDSDYAGSERRRH